MTAGEVSSTAILAGRARRLVETARLALERRAVLVEGLADIPSTAHDAGDLELMTGLVDDLAFVVDLLSSPPELIGYAA